mgnify:CR=1 FL=1
MLWRKLCPPVSISTHFSRMLLSSHWTVELAPWQLYLRALIDHQGQLVKLVAILNPWVHKEMMRSSLMALLTIILMCGQDTHMPSTLLLHLLDSEQGTHNNNWCIQCDLIETFMAQVPNPSFCLFVFLFVLCILATLTEAAHPVTTPLLPRTWSEEQKLLHLLPQA